ncbi:MAG: Ferredoxin--NADP reductase [Phycisphaerae bacterium]|nr:Ferredoxin--NADP reductase [Phycisphaerae bacterium]
MMEMILYGRGGQGGVTLAKLIATAYFLRGQQVQAFGVYAAERSGAPVQAFVRIDSQEITNHNQIREPDHVVVLDRTLIAPRITTGLKTDGWIVLNTPDHPEQYAEQFAGRRLATIDATGIAVANGLGTKAVPIVNTTLLGAVARVLGLEWADVTGALAELEFGGGNITAAKQAYEQVLMQQLAGSLVFSTATGPAAGSAVAGLFDEVVGSQPRIHTGDWANRAPQRRQLTPPCNQGCPAGNDVRTFVEQVSREDADAALATLLETSPFPGVCGRVCPAPCMSACNRHEYDEALNIREIERYAADHGRRPEPLRPIRPQRVAVVGSGPAGLSATYHLARLGYPVTLIEAGQELGGVLRTGIPTYRLPREVLDSEIHYIIAHGVQVQKGVRIKREGLLGLSREYAAVFVATGLQETRALNLGNLHADMVMEGLDFLDQARRHEIFLQDRRVVVIGGGNTAMDAARSALRLGARHVQVIYRRTRAEMPAIAEEIEEAIEEGIELSELVAPLQLQNNGDGTVLTCQRMRLGEPDESGRPRPVADTCEDAIFDVPCDLVLLALGQSPDLSILPEGSEITENGQLLGLAAAPIFAGGDLATNEGTVTAAIGNGRRAALHIHLTLTGEDLFPPEPEPTAQPAQITMHLFKHALREKSAAVAPATRRRTFVEVRQGYVDEPGHHPAVTEAQRCFSCGVCNNCDTCLTYCPEGILQRRGDRDYRFDYDFCKGCGICATQCPRGVIYMAEL